MKRAIIFSLIMLVSLQAAAADKAPSPTPNPAAPAKSPAAPTANDQLTLDATTVTGNRELPKVMYIVPWKKAELGQLPGQPFNSLLNEVLQPVDREVFRREVDYYGVVAGKDRTAPVNPAQPTSANDSGR